MRLNFSFGQDAANMKKNKNGSYTSAEVITHSKISYRQLFHWELKGLLNPRRIKLGSREFKRYSQGDYDNAKLIKDLLDDGYALPNSKMLDLILKKRMIEDELKYRLRIEEALFKISSGLINPEDLDRAVNESLKTLSSVTSVNRVYIFEYRPDGKAFSNTYEYCLNAEPQIHNLQNMEVELAAWWTEKLRKGENIVISDLNALEDRVVYGILAAQSIKSLLVVPMSNKDNLFGFMGFDDTENPREWLEQDINILRTASDIVTRGILHNRKVKAGPK
jgi:DNA-binding transcriptional MerR regulator